jgi:hypothetical protein
MVDQVMPKKGDTLELPFNDPASIAPSRPSLPPPD